ncbi:MAG: DUF2071 domain-containing protein [Chthoniobacter sp.]
MRFTGEMFLRPKVNGWSVLTTLRHFAIVSYAVPAERVRPYVPAAFALDTFSGADGNPVVWVSVVPFEDQDFRFAAAPWAKFRFGQTNYRTYVIRRATGERVVWFFGTTLASWAVRLPQIMWGLPWHRGRMKFDCTYDPATRRYAKYELVTKSRWGAMELKLESAGKAVSALEGVEDFEGGMVVLTHPLVGYFRRRDGKLGRYSAWHDPMKPTEGRVVEARIEVLDRLGLVPYAEQGSPHSVLIQHEWDFTIYLPPVRVREVEKEEPGRLEAGLVL